MNEVLVSLKAALQAPAGTDWNAALRSLATLMSLLKVDGHAEGERPAIERLGAQFAPDPGSVPAMLDAVTEQGLLVQNGTRLVSDLHLEGGGLKVNGKQLQ